jgi:hypothetical protein
MHNLKNMHLCSTCEICKVDLHLEIVPITLPSGLGIYNLQFFLECQIWSSRGGPLPYYNIFNRAKFPLNQINMVYLKNIFYSS